MDVYRRNGFGWTKENSSKGGIARKDYNSISPKLIDLTRCYPIQ